MLGTGTFMTVHFEPHRAISAPLQTEEERPVMKLNTSFSLKLPALAFSLLTLPAGAAVIFDSGAPNGYGFYSDPGASQIIGVAFTLDSTVTVRDVTWWGGQEPSGSLNGADNFTIGFYGFGGALPDTVPSVVHAVNPSRVNDGTIFGSLQQYRYTASIPDTVLVAGTWFISIVNDLDDPDDDWAWSRTNTVRPFFEKSTPDGPWQQLFYPEDRLSVILSGVGGGAGGADGPGGEVPEPETAAMFCLGVAGLITLRRAR
jgi:hypothetical protein